MPETHIAVAEEVDRCAAHRAAAAAAKALDATLRTVLGLR